MQETAVKEAVNQAGSRVMQYPTSPLQRALFKWPVQLWRLGLGPVLGRVFVLFTHTGRKSGLARRTLTEFHLLDGQIYIPCAFGEKAQWYRNIKADPHVTVQTAYGTMPAIARRVTDDEELLAAYNIMHQRNPVMVDWYLQSLDIEPTAEDIRAKKDRIYFITFDPTNDPTPPPLEADLVWVWAVVGVVLGLLMLLRPRRRD